MRYIRFILFGVLFAGAVSDVSARTYYLPDYQSEFIYGSRVQDDSGQHTSTPSCSSYGYYSAPQTNMDCTPHRPAPGLTCYSCVCGSQFQYSQKAKPYCLSPKVLAGESCGDKWTECVCPASNFPYTKENCSYNLGGGTCSDDNGMHYTACKNPCDDVKDAAPKVTCPAGSGYPAGSCEEYWNTCPSKCRIAFSDCCHALPDNITDIGCEKYWDDCTSKCEIGKTCSKNDCTGYNLTSMAQDPDYVQYESCTPGCGDNTPKYKIVSCEEGFVLNSNKTWCDDAPCPADTALRVDQCSPKLMHGAYKLGDRVAWSGEQGCFKCAIDWCGNDGVYRYAQTVGECGSIPNGSYHLEDTGEPCKRCVVSCNSGYTATADNRCEDTRCAIHDSAPDNATVVKKANGKYEITKCPENYFVQRDDNNCITLCYCYGIMCPTTCDYNARCGGKPDNGKWIGDGVLNISTGCQGCKLACDSGYTATADNRCEYTKCAIHSSLPTGALGSKKANGKYEVTGCAEGYSMETDSEGCNVCKCWDKNTACSKCNKSVTPNGVGCYKCCTGSPYTCEACL